LSILDGVAQCPRHGMKSHQQHWWNQPDFLGRSAVHNVQENRRSKLRAISERNYYHLKIVLIAKSHLVSHLEIERNGMS
jgi:hypothetical protein